MIGNKKGHLQAPIASEEEMTTTIYALRSYRGERKRAHEENESSDQIKNQKTK